MKTSRIFLIFSAALTFAAIALAPPPAQAAGLRGRQGGGRHAQAGGRIQAALDKLNLSSDQKAKIKPITDKAKQQVMGLKGDTSLDTEAKKAKAKEIVFTAFQQIMPILTPQQQDQLMQMFQQARAKKGGA